MKIINSISRIYEEQKQINHLLQQQVDRIMGSIKQPRWHYESRVKLEESFALKLETGRVKNPAMMEDFFACTLVVENLDQIEYAIILLNEYFEIKEKRPKKGDFTHKASSSFVFDDLRLYGVLKNNELKPVGPINDVLFEIQIKTFLQHAWSLATHDLIYKSDEINWAKERIAYQIKAAFEQAEMTISGVPSLVNTKEIAKDNFETKELKAILIFYKTLFKEVDLPVDLTRLCRNTKDLINSLEIKIPVLTQMMEREFTQGRGTNLKNLSPYILILQSIINQAPDLFQKYIDVEKRFKIIAPKEIDFVKIDFKGKPNIIAL